MTENSQDSNQTMHLKEALRQVMRHKNQALGKVAHETQSLSIRDTITSHPNWQAAQRILAYLPRKDEPNILPLLHMALDKGKTIALPQYQQNNGAYRPVIISHLEKDLEPGLYGILEPKSTCIPMAGQSVDLTLIPGMAFDDKGWRLGRGKGFYDRMIPQLAGLRCGLAFDYQRVEAVPHDDLDQKMDWIITPERWIKSGSEV